MCSTHLFDLSGVSEHTIGWLMSAYPSSQSNSNVLFLLLLGLMVASTIWDWEVGIKIERLQSAYMWSICVLEHSISITRCPKDRLIIHLSVQHCFLLLSRPLLSFCCHDNCFFDMYVMWCIWCLGTICLKGLVFISVLLFWLNIVES